MSPPVEHYFASSQGELCWFEWGSAAHAQSEGAPSLLLLHATGFHARCWDRLIAALPAAAHVIAVDQLGHGRSAKPAAVTQWTDVAAGVIELVAAQGWTFDLVTGHSMGGHIAVQLAAALPAQVKALALIDPVILPQAAYRAEANFSVTAAIVAKRRGQWASVQEMVDRFAERHPYRLWERAVLNDYCQFGLLPASEGGLLLACPPAVEASFYASSLSVDPYRCIAAIDCPVTVIRAPQGSGDGAMDFANSPTPPDLVSAFARGRDIYVDDLTHFMPMEDPARIAGLLLNAIDQG